MLGDRGLFGLRVFVGTTVLVTGMAVLPLSSLGQAGPAGPPGTLFGAYVQGATHDPEDEEAAVEARERDLGRPLAIDHHFYPWSKEFPTAREIRDLERGRIPMISWNGDLSLGIALGLQDDLIKARADAVRALPGRVLIRWMWEMDGKRKANDAVHPELYIAAWRHIHDVFVSRGATNAAWVWCPNAFSFEPGGVGPSFYPGDDYVDWIGADGYNWSPGRAGDTWHSFADIFAAFYAWGTARRKPLMIGEFGVQERAPAEKATWLEDARAALKTQFPGIRAIVYFDADKDFNWRMDTSEAALSAFRAMAADPWFQPERLLAEAVRR